MNGPVDVRAIDVVAAIENCAAYLREEMGLIKAADQMGAVGAAVAELIEAADPLTSAAHDSGLMADILKGMRSHEAESMRAAIVRLDAALARVGGAS